MIERLLIANRGEIARRVIRTSRRLGIETVAVYSDADLDAAHVADADWSVPIGGQAPSESYLRIEAMLDAAARTGADAVHPGYGFLAENADFARAVIDAGLIFVGPRPEVISVMGSKLEAKQRMDGAGVPVLPSCDLTGVPESGLAEAVEPIGYPLLIKASAGGGGRGMRIVASPGDLAAGAEAAAREAESAFGDAAIYAERYVAPSRHVEVQIFGDDAGRVIHLGERECSIQRRHQKVIEEAPSPTIDDATRLALHAAAVRAGEAIGYTNAGTVEFLVGEAASDRSTEFYFLEVNTRLQVEHPVTEATLDLDLVALQLDVAAGEPVPLQATIGPPVGHAIEARLYAEDPTADFRPSVGVIHHLSFPDDDIRVDAALDRAGTISQFYDPMIAKVVVHAETRPQAARRLASSLSRTVIDGVTTNRDLLVRTLRHPEFLAGQGDSDFFARNPPDHLGRPLVEDEELAVYAAAAALGRQAANRADDRHTGGVASGFRNVATLPQRVTLEPERGAPLEVDYRFDRGRLIELAVDGHPLAAPTAHSIAPDRIDLAVGGVRRQFEVLELDGRYAVSTSTGAVVFGVAPRFGEPQSTVDEGSTVATMPGTIVAVRVKVGDVVEAGDVLIVMEAMKMELTVTASTAGTVATVPVAVGDTVDAGSPLVVIT